MNLKKWREEAIKYTHKDFIMDSTQDGQMLNHLAKLNWRMMRVDDWFVF
tara:strand:+ start:899 stop:1045 length:147 start_codon:yes stop_codon:yes gene_type:complete